MSDNEQHNETRYTVADIVAIVRRAAQYYEGEAEKSKDLLRESFELSAANYREISNLVEAAWKRERAKVESDALAVGGIVEAARNKPDDAAAMREALREAIGETCAGCKRDCDDCMNLKSGWMKKAKAALSAPARNCDLYDDAETAWRAWLEDKENWDEFGSPELELCEWLFASANKKGENDGIK